MGVILSVYQLFVSRAKNANQIIVKPFIFRIYIQLLEPYFVVLDVNVISVNLTIYADSENMLLMHSFSKQALLLSPLASYQSLFLPSCMLVWNVRRQPPCCLHRI